MFESPTFWVFVSFAICVIALWGKVSRFVFGALDRHAEQIRDEIDGARQLLDDARAAYAQQLKRVDAVRAEVAEILAQGRQDAEQVRAYVMAHRRAKIGPQRA